MFEKIFKKSHSEKLQYNCIVQKPVLRCSICTGEQVAGLKDIRTGKFQEIMVVRTQADLEQFQKMVGTKDIDKEY